MEAFLFGVNQFYPGVVGQQPLSASKRPYSLSITIYKDRLCWSLTNKNVRTPSCFEKFGLPGYFLHRP